MKKVIFSVVLLLCVVTCWSQQLIDIKYSNDPYSRKDINELLDNLSAAGGSLLTRPDWHVSESAITWTLAMAVKSGGCGVVISEYMGYRYMTIVWVKDKVAKDIIAYVFLMGESRRFR